MNEAGSESFMLDLYKNETYEVLQNIIKKDVDSFSPLGHALIITVL
jgi:hypothetical protein